MRRKGEKHKPVGLTKWVGAKTRAYNTRELLHQPVWQSSPTNLSLFLCTIVAFLDLLFFFHFHFHQISVEWKLKIRLEQWSITSHRLTDAGQPSKTIRTRQLVDPKTIGKPLNTMVAPNHSIQWWWLLSKPSKNCDIYYDEVSVCLSVCL